jgi:anti-anti-sigma factor
MSAVSPHIASLGREDNTTWPPPAWESHSARFSAKWDAERVVVTAHGELDASNATQFVDYFDLCVTDSAPLIVDLSGLEFFGTAGFSALHVINVRCAGAKLRWAVVPSPAVSRLLRICDPDHALPLIPSVHAMPDTDDDDPDQNRLFQLVP